MPLTGSVPSEQLTPVFNSTVPVALTSKKHGVPVPPPAWSSVIAPPQAPKGTIFREVPSMYFFSTFRSKAHAGPVIAASPFGRWIVTFGVSVVPVGQSPDGVVPTYPVISIRYECGAPGLMVMSTSFCSVGVVVVWGVVQ